MPTVETSIDFDLEDFEDDIKREYCDCGNCLNERKDINVALEEYIKEMYKELYVFPEKNRKFKSYEEIYYDLCDMLL